MNKRIKELAEQAKFMAEEDINKQISYNTELRAFAERFAQLIVQDIHQYVDGLDTAQIISRGILKRYEMEK